MPPALLGVVALLVIGAIVFFYLRSQKPAELPAEEEKDALPAGKPKQDSVETSKPKAEVETSKPKAPATAEAKPAAVKSADKTAPKSEPKAEVVKTEPATAAPVVASSSPTVEASKPEAATSPVASSAESSSNTSVESTSKPEPTPEPVVAAPVVEATPPAPPTATTSAKPVATRPAKTEARDVSALKKGLKSARGSWVQRLVGIFSGKKELDPELMTQMEELLLTGDVGAKTTETLLEQLKTRLDKKDLSDEEVVWSTLRQSANELIDVQAPAFGSSKPAGNPLVILIVGVNGVGKTTTIGKLAALYKAQGKKVVLAAGDTFRAAAVAQLEAWAKRVGVSVVKGKDLTKPGAVVFDAVQTAVKEGADVVLCDTAGRLHTKTPLMEELRKLGDAATKALPGAPHEILLVLDATTGQNAVIQVAEFKTALAVSGIVLTKLDGTAKGGVILSVCNEHKLPVRFIGVGEKVDDLREFNADEFTEALFSTTKGEDAEVAG